MMCKSPRGWDSPCAAGTLIGEPSLRTPRLCTGENLTTCRSTRIGLSHGKQAPGRVAGLVSRAQLSLQDAIQLNGSNRMVAGLFDQSCSWHLTALVPRALGDHDRNDPLRPNKRLKLTARVDCGMNLSSARRSLSAIS